MKIKCVWVFRTGDNGRRWKAKQKDASNMSGDEVIEMITALLAQQETVRVIFEKGDILENDR